MSKQPKTLTPAEVNHLRLLLGWIRTEIGPTPEELKATIASLNLDISEIDQDAKNRLMQSHLKAETIPKYVRQAVKMLEKALKGEGWDTVDGEFSESEGNELPHGSSSTTRKIAPPNTQ